MRKGTRVKANKDITDIMIFHGGIGVVVVKRETQGVIASVDNSLLDVRFDNGRHIWLDEKHLLTTTP